MSHNAMSVVLKMVWERRSAPNSLNKASIRLKGFPHRIFLFHLPTLHYTLIGLTRERFVALGLLSWTHFRTRYWGVFTLQGTRRFASCVWFIVLRNLGNRWKGKGENWFHYTKVLFCRCCWNRRDVILFCVVQKITASRENRGELLGDEVMQTASYRNCTQVTLIEFKQLLHGRKWEFVFTLQSHFVDFSHDH